MSQLKNVVEPFGEVNVYPEGGKVRVVATILMEPHREGAQTGIALDGSGSMSKLYGIEDGSRVLSPIFGGPKKLHNEVTPVAQQLCSYLARTIDADGGTTCIYWAVGDGGGEVEVIGDLTADQAERHVFGPPREFGTGTQLLPAVRYFVDRFKTAPWGFYVFITDGELHDLEHVMDYSVRLAREIHAGRRKPVKFVLIGLGPDVNEEQMTALDDLDSGTPIDLWDHKLAAEMRMLQEIFAEVVDKNARVADNGRILDPQGRVIKDYSVSGLTALMEFEVPAGTDYFTLEVNGHRINQALSDRARVPTAERPAAPPAPAPVQPSAVPPPMPKAAPVPKPPPASKAPPVAAPATSSGDDDPDAEWKQLNLEFGAPEAGPVDIDLEKPKDD